MVRIDGQRGLGLYQWGCLPICKKLFGFIAKMRQASYKSNAKTTCRTRRPALPHIVIPAKAGIQRGAGAGRLLPLRIPYSRRRGSSRVRSP